MTTVLVYKRDEKQLTLKARWEDGTWAYDEPGFSEKSTLEGQPPEYFIRRWQGPIYYATFKRNAPPQPDQFEIETTKNAVRSTDERVLGDFMKAKLLKVEQYKRGDLDEDDYSTEEWNRIKGWVDELG